MLPEASAETASVRVIIDSQQTVEIVQPRNGADAAKWQTANRLDIVLNAV